MGELPVVSTIIPAHNEEATLERCLASLEKLNYPSDKLEIILINDGSTDGTKKIIEGYIRKSKYNCKYIETEGVGAPKARNIGLNSAKGEDVAFTDADCIVERDWLMDLVKNFNNKEIVSVGGPNITPEDDTELAKCVGVVLTFLSKPGSRYASIPNKPMEIYHNPTCNVAYRKEVIEEVGGFNEKLVNCEDEELDYRIKDRGYKILYTPDAKVYHYRRPTWKKFAKMAYSYAVGRMQAIKLHQKMGRWYHYTPPAIISTIILLLILSLLSAVYLWWALSILIIGGIGIGVMGLYLGNKTKLSNFLTYCVLIAIWFWCSGFGYFRGLVMKKKAFEKRGECE
jgi:cellulose synthase/poly-beta-1,6-N-acetylglucosamine synthase-like glycosyltransferase